jgi:hypothetical protein
VGKAISRLIQIWHAPTVGPAEVILSLTAAAYGVGLLLPQEEFSIYRVQGHMAASFSERTWGTVFLLIGSSRMMSVIWSWYKGRIWLTSLSIGAWFYLALSFALASPLNPRVVVLSVWAMCETWTLFRIHQKE